jgi:hypothetical protein
VERRSEPQAAVTRKAQAQIKRITFLAGMTLPDQDSIPEIGEAGGSGGDVLPLDVGFD